MSELIKSITVHVRKDHICFGCGEKILKDSMAKKDTCVDDVICDFYYCERCIRLEEKIKDDNELLELWREDFEFSTGIGQNELIEFAKEHDIVLEEQTK